MNGWLLRKGRKFPYSFARRHFRLNFERRELTYGLTTSSTKRAFRLDESCSIRDEASSKDKNGDVVKAFVLTLWSSGTSISGTASSSSSGDGRRRPFKLHVAEREAVIDRWKSAIVRCIVKGGGSPRHRRSSVRLLEGPKAVDFVCSISSVKARNLKNIEYFGTVDPRCVFVIGARKMDTEEIRDSRDPIWCQEWTFLMTLSEEGLRKTRVLVQVWDGESSVIGEP